MAYSLVEQGRRLSNPALRDVAERMKAALAEVALAWALRRALAPRDWRLLGAVGTALASSYLGWRLRGDGAIRPAGHRFRQGRRRPRGWPSGDAPPGHGRSSLTERAA